MSKTLSINVNGTLTEGHPIGVQKIILGDLRQQEYIDNEGNKQTIQRSSGTVLYDLAEKRNRPWFVLCLDTGSRS